MGSERLIAGFITGWIVLVLTIAAPKARAESSSEDAVIVDRIVAVVGGAGERGRERRIVTDYELEVEARLVLAERAHSVDVAMERPLTGRLLGAVLETMIHHLLIVGEAARLELVSVTDQELAELRQELEQRLGGPGQLERFAERVGAPERLIDQIIRRRAQVASFLERNVNLTVRVTTADVEQVYRSGEHPFGDRPLEEIRASLEAFLVARRQRRRLSQWLDEARQRSVVRVIPR